MVLLLASAIRGVRCRLHCNLLCRSNFFGAKMQYVNGNEGHEKNPEQPEKSEELTVYDISALTTDKALVRRKVPSR